MANNRYYLYCPCGEQCYLGKSLSDGIYNVRGGPQSFAVRQHEGATVVVPEAEPVETHDQGQARFLADVYDWMWKHLRDPGCYNKRVELGMHPEEDVLSNEWVKGEIFKVLTEYDERIK